MQKCPWRCSYVLNCKRKKDQSAICQFLLLSLKFNSTIKMPSVGILLCFIEFQNNFRKGLPFLAFFHSIKFLNFSKNLDLLSLFLGNTEYLTSKFQITTSKNGIHKSKPLIQNSKLWSLQFAFILHTKQLF